MNTQHKFTLIVASLLIVLFTVGAFYVARVKNDVTISNSVATDNQNPVPTENQALATSSQINTQTSDGLSAQFPDFSSNGYYQTINWQLTVESAPFVCTEAVATNPAEENVHQTTIDNNVYCIHSESGGAAAGTDFTDYQYVGQKYGKLITVSFDLGITNCANYDEGEAESECQSIESKIGNSLDSAVDQVFASIK